MSAKSRIIAWWRRLLIKLGIKDKPTPPIPTPTPPPRLVFLTLWVGDRLSASEREAVCKWATERGFNAVLTGRVPGHEAGADAFIRTCATHGLYVAASVGPYSYSNDPLPHLAVAGDAAIQAYASKAAKEVAAHANVVCIWADGLDVRDAKMGWPAGTVKKYARLTTAGIKEGIAASKRKDILVAVHPLHGTAAVGFPDTDIDTLQSGHSQGQSVDFVKGLYDSCKRRVWNMEPCYEGLDGVSKDEILAVAKLDRQKGFWGTFGNIHIAIWDAQAGAAMKSSCAAEVARILR